MPVLRFLIFIIALFISTGTRGQQNDSIVTKQDTVKRELTTKPVKSTPVVKSAERLRLEKMPRIAAFRSAIIPGWGQITNKRWWKVPFVYGGFVGIALVYDFNRTYYKMFLTEAQNREYNLRNPPIKKPVNPDYGRLSTTGIITIKDGYRRNRDLSVLGGLAFYTITIVDAYVDAKFFRFDISDELALRVKPALQQQPSINAMSSPVPSVKLSLSFSK